MSFVSVKDGMVRDACTELSKKIDAVIKETLDKYCPDWTMQDVQMRAKFITRATDPYGYQMLYIDGEPALEMFPTETKMKDGCLCIEFNYRIFMR